MFRSKYIYVKSKSSSSVSSNPSSNIFSILLKFSEHKEILVLLANSCKTLRNESAKLRNKSEKYEFKVQQCIAREIVPLSMKKNLTKLQELEWFIATVPISYANIPPEIAHKLLEWNRCCGENPGRPSYREYQYFKSRLILDEKKESEITHNKVLQFKINYQDVKSKMPEVLQIIKRNTSTSCGLGEVCYVTGVPFIIISFIACCWCGPEIPAFSFGGMGACPIATGHILNLCEKSDLKGLAQKTQKSVDQIGQLSGFNFIENFNFKEMITREKASIKNELKELDELKRVTHVIRLFSTRTNEEKIDQCENTVRSVRI